MPAARTRLVLLGQDRIESASQELALAALMLRSTRLDSAEVVRVYVAQEPTVAFTARDLRSPTIGAAVKAAHAAGFTTVVRSPGGRMVAYDSGAVVIDHVDRTTGLGAAGWTTFAENAMAHRSVLARLGIADVRVGQVDGEYCPGEFSVNVAGAVKIVGSAQRVTPGGSLFSTVVQVDLTDRVRAVITEVSAALGYELRASSVGGARDYLPSLTAGAVAAAFAEDYRSRLSASDGQLPAELVTQAITARPHNSDPEPFHVDDWARANAAPA